MWNVFSLYHNSLSVSVSFLFFLIGIYIYLYSQSTSHFSRRPSKSSTIVPQVGSDMMVFLNVASVLELVFIDYLFLRGGVNANVHMYRLGSKQKNDRS